MSSYYKASGEWGSHVVRLWNDSGVLLLAQANFTNENSFGWQEAALTTPYPITAGVKYRVSYNVNANGYGAKIRSAFSPRVDCGAASTVKVSLPLSVCLSAARLWLSRDGRCARPAS